MRSGSGRGGGALPHEGSGSGRGDGTFMPLSRIVAPYERQTSASSSSVSRNASAAAASRPTSRGRSQQPAARGRGRGAYPGTNECSRSIGRVVTGRAAPAVSSKRPERERLAQARTIDRPTDRPKRPIDQRPTERPTHIDRPPTDRPRRRRREASAAGSRSGPARSGAG